MNFMVEENRDENKKKFPSPPLLFLKFWFWLRELHENY